MKDAVNRFKSAEVGIQEAVGEVSWGHVLAKLGGLEARHACGLDGPAKSLGLGDGPVGLGALVGGGILEEPHQEARPREL